MAHTQDKDEWLAAVAELGAIVDPDGASMIGMRNVVLIVAHIDRDPIGYWDDLYAGVGIGVIYEKKSPQLQWD